MIFTTALKAAQAVLLFILGQLPWLPTSSFLDKIGVSKYHLIGSPCSKRNLEITNLPLYVFISVKY